MQVHASKIRRPGQAPRYNGAQGVCTCSCSISVLHQLNRSGFVVDLELKQHREHVHSPAHPSVCYIDKDAQGHQGASFSHQPNINHSAAHSNVNYQQMSTTNQPTNANYQPHINHPASHINVNYRTNFATAAAVRVLNCCEFHASLDALCMAHPIIGPYATCFQASTPESCLLNPVYMGLQGGIQHNAAGRRPRSGKVHRSPQPHTW